MASNGPLPLAPGAVIGILGGGQLGRMAAQAAAQMGYRSHVYCPTAHEPASQVTDLCTVAAYDDWAALSVFADHVDVVTFEFENVPAATAAHLAERVAVHPSPQVLAICQNRLREKGFCRSVGVPTTQYAPVRDRESLQAALANFPLPAVLKTTELGYDGKGQTTLMPGADPAEAWAAIAGDKGELEAILEAFVDFRLEISVIVARDATGHIESFVPVENRHKNHILDKTLAPADIPDAVAAQAKAIATTIAEKIDLTGMLGIEMFVTRDDQVLVNEMAPRPHNSGHWTMDACLVSQFEQFIRAVAGLPLGAPKRHSNAVMNNLVGADANHWLELLAEPGAKLHLYGKNQARPGRKMGHVNRLLPLDVKPTSLD